MSIHRFMRFALCLPSGLLLPAMSGAQQFNNEQIDQLTAQIALYPAALLSQVLMASTYPADVTAAARWARAAKRMQKAE